MKRALCDKFMKTIEFLSIINKKTFFSCVLKLVSLTYMSTLTNRFFCFTLNRIELTFKLIFTAENKLKSKKEMDVLTQIVLRSMQNSFLRNVKIMTILTS